MRQARGRVRRRKSKESISYATTSAELNELRRRLTLRSDGRPPFAAGATTATASCELTHSVDADGSSTSLSLAPALLRRVVLPVGLGAAARPFVAGARAFSVGADSFPLSISSVTQVHV